MQEWAAQVAASPYLLPDAQGSGTVLVSAGAGGGEKTGEDQGGLVIQEESSGMKLPLWVWITVIVVVFLLLVSLIGAVMWCIRRRQFTRDVVRPRIRVVTFVRILKFKL